MMDALREAVWREHMHLQLWSVVGSEERALQIEVEAERRARESFSSYADEVEKLYRAALWGALPPHLAAG